MAVLVDKSTKPLSGPIRWIRTGPAREGHSPLPGLCSISRTLVRHHRIDPTKRKRSRCDYKRGERSRSMELCQMDVVGRFHLADRTELKKVSGLDEHSRLCVSARLILRATAKPVVAALEHALKAHGVPGQILTDNGSLRATAEKTRGPASPRRPSNPPSPSPTNLRPTARSSGSTAPCSRNAPCSTNGPTPGPTAQRPLEPRPSTSGSTCPTITGTTAIGGNPLVGVNNNVVGQNT